MSTEEQDAAMLALLKEYRAVDKNVTLLKSELNRAERLLRTAADLLKRIELKPSSLDDTALSDAIADLPQPEKLSSQVLELINEQDRLRFLTEERQRLGL